MSLNNNKSIMEIYGITRSYVKFSNSRSYLTGVAVVELWQRLSMWSACWKMFLSFDKKTSGNNGTEHICLVTPTPERISRITELHIV